MIERGRKTPNVLCKHQGTEVSYAFCLLRGENSNYIGIFTNRAISLGIVIEKILLNALDLGGFSETASINLRVTLNVTFLTVEDGGNQPRRIEAEKKVIGHGELELSFHEFFCVNIFVFVAHGGKFGNFVNSRDKIDVVRYGGTQ